MNNSSSYYQYQSRPNLTYNYTIGESLTTLNREKEK